MFEFNVLLSKSNEIKHCKCKDNIEASSFTQSFNDNIYYLFIIFDTLFLIEKDYHKILFNPGR